MKRLISDPGKYCEPYIISVAVDAQKQTNSGLLFNYMPFPKVARGGKVTMLGDGHLLYGPQNPGEFVALSILFMESDKDIRNIGELIQQTVKSKAVELGLAAVMAAQPTAGTVLGIVKELAVHVGGILAKNGDDELFRTDGTFLRDHPCPYHINRKYSFENNYLKFGLKILPLETSNNMGEGASPTSISL